ncbi:MAG: transposase [Thermoplasmata archaeon]
MGQDAILNMRDQKLVQADGIASHPEVIEKINETEWSVPSQTGFGRYLVFLDGRQFRCTCPDYSKRVLPCKHILAIRELRLRAAGHTPGTPAPTVRKQYAQHPSYTRGQTEEMRLVDSLLRELVRDVADIPRTPGARGRPKTPLPDEIFCAILKVYSGLSGRRAHGVYENVADRGLLEKTPSYLVASRLLARPEVTPILYNLLSMTAHPLAGLEEGGTVAPDSSGIQTTSFGGWREEKHGEKRQKRWLKVHAMVGTKTHVIIRAFVDSANSGDSPQFETLLRGSLEDGFRPSVVVADKGSPPI